MTGAELITAERATHAARGWTAENDDRQTLQQLIECAGLIIAGVSWNGDYRPGTDYEWPRERAEHVRKKYEADKVHRLAIAGALIAAEIDRLQRAEQYALATGDAT